MNLIDRIKSAVFPSRPQDVHHLQVDQLQTLARQIATTRSDEIACDECWEALDCFVEMELAGTQAEQAMPLVADHLSRCQECQEEFQALLEAVRALS